MRAPATGTFTQSGGAATLSSGLYLGGGPTGIGTYNLSGTGTLSAPTEGLGYNYTGSGGTGTFNQSGGTNTVSGNLYLGDNSASQATYVLGGTGHLSAPNEYVAYAPATTALFQQTGGTNTANYLSISSGGTYQLSGGAATVASLALAAGGTCQLDGGTLTINGSLANQGLIEGNGAAATLTANCIVDLTSGAWQDYSGWSVNVGANSLLVVPAGFNPSSAFAGYSSQGLLYTAGSTLNVPAGKAFAGTYSFTGPVVCQGTLTASGGPLNFNNGLTVSGSGSISTGGGNVVVNDSVSAITGGTLTAGSEYVGYNGTGLWTHSAGTNTVSNALYLGYNTADSGTYALSATGRLAAATEYVGYNGTGSFTQSGGSNTLSGTLYLGYNATSGGAYNLSGGSLDERGRVRRLFRHGQLHPVRRNKHLERRPLPRQWRDRQRDLQPGRRHALQPHPVYRLLRQGPFHANRRRQHGLDRALSRLQCRRQRHRQF